MIAVTKRHIERIVGTIRTEATDSLVEEGALQLIADGKPVATIMRTPGADADLVRGLLFAEGLGQPTFSLRPQQAVIDLPAHAFAERGMLASAACGVCGRAELDDLRARHAVNVGTSTIAARVVTALPEALRAAQAAFALTGGLHAAGLFSLRGELLIAREDVGRHNAVDKVIGAALAQELPFAECALMLSGRLGYELMQKAIAAGIPIVAAVSAPSTLAVELAEQFRVAALGFVRGESFNVYAHGWRVTS